MSQKKLIQYLNEAFEEVAEDNTTSNVEPLNTPFAFSDKVIDPKDSAYKKRVATTDRFFKKIEAKINEINYSDFKSDDSMTARQKINVNLQEISRKLREVEQMVNHAQRLKIEDGHTNEVFWKRTQGSFVKIKERLNRLSNKIVEITG